MTWPVEQSGRGADMGPIPPLRLALRTTLCASLLTAVGICACSEPSDVVGSTPAKRPETAESSTDPRAAAASALGSGSTRPAALAGTWYPGDPETLREEIARRMPATPAEGEPVLALVGPHAGLRYSGSVAASAYARLRNQRVRRVFLLGPSHYASFTGVALPAPELAFYATPLGKLPIDRETLQHLRGRVGFMGPERAHEPEHSLEMHAVFLAALFPETRIVPLLVGRVPDVGSARALAARIRPLIGPGDVVITSSDFTHYGPRYNYLPFRERVPEKLAELADQALANLVTVDGNGFSTHLETTGDTICGREPVRLLLELLPPGTRGKEVARDTSGRITGDYSNSVTYLSLAFLHSDGWTGQSRQEVEPETREVPAMEKDSFLDPETEQQALAMARRALEIYLGTGRVPAEQELNVPSAGPFQEKRAAFVTLKREGQLRGCIGHIWPVQELWCDIRDNAIAAAARDHRFQPVTRDELPQLHLEVSVLTPPQPIPRPEAFEVGRHGIVLQLGGRRAVFLPQVAPEQGWDRETTLSHLARKAGLPPSAWTEPHVSFEVFEAQVVSEPHRRL